MFGHAGLPMKKVAAVFAVALLILLHTFFWISLESTIPNIEKENGVMENFQAVCLACCMLCWGRIRIRSSNPERLFWTSLALLSASILVLEVDFRQLNAPLLNTVMNGRIRDIWLGSLWLIALIFFIRNPRPVLATFLAWMRTPSGLLMILGGMFWILSALIDKSLLGEKNLFTEELMEDNATLLMLAAAILDLRLVGSNKNDRQ